MTGVVAALVLGPLTWSFLEYVIHRWLGHDTRTRPNPFATEHVRHHGEGNYFAPSWKKALAALAVVGLLSGPAISLVGASAGLAFVVSFAGAYLAYEAMHRREHTHAGIGAYGRFARRHHFYHHFTDPKMNHGVSSPLWDWVFGTLRPPGVIRVPERLAIHWLIDPETRALRPEYAEHYELIPARRG